MGKRRKKTDYTKYIIDVSHRKGLNLQSCNAFYDSDEELKKIIKELDEQMRQLELMEKKYYSNNACVERVSNRGSLTLIHEKATNFISKKNNKMRTDET